VDGDEPVAVTAASPRYRALSRGLNPRYAARPEVVHLATTTAQAAWAVRSAVRAGRRLTVRSGGHCSEDFVFNRDVGAVLDLSGMDRVYFDASRGAVAVEPGATLLDVYEALHRWGVVLPAGSFHSVAAGGHVAGGGFGFLSRPHGMAADHLYAVEVVVVGAGGEVRTVVATREDGDPHQDLWWAHTGGGGGNFGVVTRYWFRSPGAVGGDPRALLPPEPDGLLLGAVTLPWSGLTRAAFARLLHNFSAFHEKHKDPESPYRAVCAGLLLNHRSGGPVRVDVQVDAGHPEARVLLDGFLAEVLDGVGSGVAEPVRRVSWLELVRQHAADRRGHVDPEVRSDLKAALLSAVLPERQIEAFHRWLTRTDVDNPAISVSMAGLGGRINALDPHATAYAHRDCALHLLWMVMWRDPAEDDRWVRWNREFYAAVYADTGGVPVPNGTTDGCYLNDADADMADPRFNRSGVPWSELYYKEAYPRLRRVKARWDPGNVFRHRLSVELP
jgi:FAD/FMN-containing dehydrogenase